MAAIPSTCPWEKGTLGHRGKRGAAREDGSSGHRAEEGLSRPSGEGKEACPPWEGSWPAPRLRPSLQHCEPLHGGCSKPPGWVLGYFYRCPG